MEKHFDIRMALDCPNGDGLDVDTITDMFIEWVESNGWFTGGGIAELDENGNLIGTDEPPFTEVGKTTEITNLREEISNLRAEINTLSRENAHLRNILNSPIESEDYLD